MKRRQDLVDITDFNFIIHSTKDNYQENIQQLKKEISKFITQQDFYTKQEHLYGIYFFDVFFEFEPLKPIYIESKLSPLAIDILIGAFQKVASKIDEEIYLDEEFIANLFVKYFGARKKGNQEVQKLDGNPLYVGIRQNWELTVSHYWNEIDLLEIDSKIISEIKSFIESANVKN